MSKPTYETLEPHVLQMIEQRTGKNDKTHWIIFVKASAH